jgi:hypothetical protein
LSRLQGQHEHADQELHQWDSILTDTWDPRNIAKISFRLVGLVPAPRGLDAGVIRHCADPEMKPVLDDAAARSLLGRRSPDAVVVTTPHLCCQSQPAKHSQGAEIEVARTRVDRDISTTLDQQRVNPLLE